MIELVVDGRSVSFDDDGGTLLDALRDRLGIHSVKDGCSPQGQCGCCTVLVDGMPRVACVTPLRRVSGREITTLDGLDDSSAWAERFCAAGASQCGFCTPGIIVRLAGLRRRRRSLDRPSIDRALGAHLCRCTGWQTIVEAAEAFDPGADLDVEAAGRDPQAAARRAAVEGGVPQQVAAEVAQGRAGFAADTAPAGALVALRAIDGSWVLGENLEEARARAAKVQGRRTTRPVVPPLDLPEGTWDRVLRTSWVEPAYLEPDASWCEPGGEPASPLANGGAFGAKRDTPVAEAARQLAERTGRAVLAMWTREDTVRLGPKRPPMAIGVRADGAGIARVVLTPGIEAAIGSVAPELLVEQVTVPGPPTSSALRAAGWAEAAVVLGSLRDAGEATVVAPTGASATASIGPSGDVEVAVRCGEVLDEVVLRSYVIGAAHQALGWVCSEGLAVEVDGTIGDLTIRSFGILRSADTPSIRVHVEPEAGPPTCGSDAAFAAVACAVWRRLGHPPDWPVGRLPS